MKTFTRLSIGLSILCLMISCGTNKDNMSSTTDNPLLQEWQGPYGGVPPFDQVTTGLFAPAIDVALQETLDEIRQIAEDANAPDFENTIATLERSGKKLERVLTIFYIWSANMSDTTFQRIELEYSPKIASLRDQIVQNEKLFARIQAVYESADLAKLTPEQQRLTWYHYSDFARSGARLDSADKARLAAINQELAVRFAKFGQLVLADEENDYVLIEAESDLAGLPPAQVNAAREYAELKGLNGWAIANTRSAVDPFLTFASNRALREKVWRMFKSRGDNDNANNTNDVIRDILRLRAERAALLGFETHAHLMLDDKMAGTPERAMDLMNAVWKPAVDRVKEEVKDMQAVARQEGQHITIEPWDYLYYAEKVRKQKYDLDQDLLKPYMQLDNLREGMFWVAGKLFGLSFTPIDDVPVFHPDVNVWRVTSKTTGKDVGLWYFDPYARPGKRSGAWMNNYRGQQKLDGEVLPIVSNNCNYVKAKPGEPVLISFDDASTLFHEFGHALHGLLSDVTYPTLQSPNVASDFVEFPSQLMERWLTTPEVLNRYALHFETGEPIPQELIEKIHRSNTFNSGYETVEYLSSAIVDMKLHLLGAREVDPRAFEKETLQSLGMPAEIAMRHRLPQFLHLFSDDMYSAGYYSYLWSEVISSDAYRAFLEAGGPYDKTVSARYARHILSVGNTVDPAETYRVFRGGDPKIEGYMEDKGFGKP